MNRRPRNILWIVADSVRYDSVFRPGEPHGLDYCLSRGTHFTQARSTGCWTLPATASMFTGLLPHEHGADTHSRGLKGVPTLAARLRSLGYATYQVTANVATTRIFGLDEGFDQVIRIWDRITLRWWNYGIYELLILGAKPRMRRAVLSRDLVSKRFMEDMSSSKVWLRSCIDEQLDVARDLVRAHNRRGQGVFLFINLMEGHFPYQVDRHFKLLSRRWWARLRELRGLFHLCNQTRLTTGRDHIPADVLALLRERQRRAWLRIAPRIDRFAREMRETGDPTTVLVCSDHGDNFGDAHWEYHFSNVTEAGNRTPLVWLRHDSDQPRVEEHPISMRDVARSILAECGEDGWHVTDEPERSLVTTESYWYSNHGKTLDRFKTNQFSFLSGTQRFVHRAGAWHGSPRATDGPEPELTRLDGVDPIEEHAPDPAAQPALRRAFRGFLHYAQTVARPTR